MLKDGIAEWYAGKTILVTGGTGFMGKVLIEKLLRCCPQVNRIYIMCRSKKGFSPSARAEEIFKLPLFEKIRKESPSSMKKLVAVEGDLLQKDLGLSLENRRLLIEQVNVVFNGAASLRLEANLKPAVEHNTIGTQKILDLCCEMKHLLAFVHLSTAFCHCEYEVLEECVYPSPVNPRDVIQLVQWMDESTLEAITPRLLGPHPNCYTFSKRLSESLVNEYAKKLPIVIARPSIVTPALKEPLPGWVDSLNGPVGVVVAAGKGLIRSMLAAEEFDAQVIPVDIAINAMIVIAAERGQTPIDQTDQVPVYNLSVGDVVKVTWGEVLSRGKKLTYEYPFEAGLWYPNGNIRMNPITHYLIVFFLQIIPAYFIDAILFLVGQKTFMVRLQKRIWVGMYVLQYFTTRKWNFSNEKSRQLTTRLNKRDQEIFYMTNVEPDVDSYLKQTLLGSRVYCMKEPLSTLPKARIQLKMLFWLDLFVQSALYCFLIWMLWDILRLNKLYSYVVNDTLKEATSSST